MIENVKPRGPFPMSDRQTRSAPASGPKEALFAALAAVAKALGHGHRLELLDLVAQGERSVDALAAATGLTVANASQHLQHLRRAGLVVARRAGKQVRYRLADEAVIPLIAALRHVAERNVAEVQRLLDGWFRERDGLEPVSRRELTRRLRDGAVTLIDVRPPEEYAAGHLPGAVSVPLAELKRRLRDLPADREVVAYCRGPYCVMSFEAVAALRKRGLTARRLEDGYPEWKAAGLPVEAGTAS
jgi:rhodanese-related sulfurtransferase/predicted transcriptional regulator